MSENFDPVKLVNSAFSPMFYVKCIMFFLGICFIGMVGWSLWKTFNPDDTTTQNNRAGVISYHYHQPKATFGCASYQVNEYYKDRATNRMK